MPESIHFVSQVNSSFWVYLDGMPEYDSDYDFYDENPEWDSGFWERTWLLDEFDQTEPATVDGAPLPSLAYSHVRPTHVLRHFR